MLALLSMGSSAFAQGTLDVPEVARKAGPVKQVVVLESEKTGTVKIRLAGTENYRDLQFDITLPAGVTAADGNVVIDTDHDVESAAQASNAQTVRFVLYSNTGANLSNDILLEIPVNVTDVTAVDGATATLSNVLSSDATAATSLTVTGSEFLFSVMKLGDINDNGKVDIGDATCVINNVVGAANDVYVEEVADVNKNNKFGEIGDATSIVNIVVGTATSAKKNFNEEVGDTLDPE